MYITIIYILIIMNNQQIEQIYKQYNRPGPAKLLELSKAAGLQVKAKDINDFLQDRTEEQQLKENKNRKESMGHIVSYSPFSRLQLDIYVMIKYEKKNNGYAYMMAIMDVFSRKAWCYPMYTKSLEDTTPTIRKFFKSSGIHDFNKHVLCVIMSDSDSAFKGDNRDEEQNFQKVLSDNNAVLESVKLNDHSALGIIDVFAKNLKRVLTKEFLESGSTNWVEKLDTIIDAYNKSPHSSLDGISPNDAISDPKKRAYVLNLNILKARGNGFVTDISPGDKVRISDVALFKKGSESRWTDEVFEVESASGKTVVLTDGQRVKRNNVLKVPKNTVSTPKNVVKIATKQRKDTLSLRRDNIDQNNVIARGPSARVGRGVNSRLADYV
jgi:hypothetical protein